MARQMPTLRRMEHLAGKPCRARTEKPAFSIVGSRNRSSSTFSTSKRRRNPAPSYWYGRTGPRTRWRAGRWRCDFIGWRPWHRQIHPTAANPRLGSRAAQSAVCIGRGIRATSGIAGAAFGRTGAGCGFAGRNPFGSRVSRFKATSSRNCCD